MSGIAGRAVGIERTLAHLDSAMTAMGKATHATDGGDLAAVGPETFQTNVALAMADLVEPDVAQSAARGPAGEAVRYLSLYGRAGMEDPGMDDLGRAALRQNINSLIQGLYDARRGLAPV